MEIMARETSLPDLVRPYAWIRDATLFLVSAELVSLGVGIARDWSLWVAYFDVSMAPGMARGMLLDGPLRGLALGLGTALVLRVARGRVGPLLGVTLVGTLSQLPWMIGSMVGGAGGINLVCGTVLLALAWMLLVPWLAVRRTDGSSLALAAGAGAVWGVVGGFLWDALVFLARLAQSAA
jgi:hypothetical protein